MAGSTNGKKRLPLEGVRVVDLATYIGGPYVAALLGDFGAEVIMVEPPEVGSSFRQVGTKYQGIPLWHTLLSRNKKGITLDLRKPEARDVLRRLVAEADVLVENFKHGMLEGWDLGFEQLQKFRPGLIMLRVSGFGQDGPYSHKPAYGRVAEALSGFATLIGEEGRPPVRAGIAVADYVTALFGTYAVMLALYHRDVNGGPGQLIDSSLYESMFTVEEYIPMAYGLLGEIRKRTGSGIPQQVPNNAYEAKDGKWVVIGCVTERDVERLWKAMGRPELAQDERFATRDARLTRRQQVDALVGAWVADLDRAEVMHHLDEAGIPAAPIYDVADCFADPHYQARNAFIYVDDPRLGRVPIQNVNPRLSHTPGRIERLGPDLGEHTEEVLRGLLGYSGDELVQLHKAGAI